MTPEEIGEAAQHIFFWDKLISEAGGVTFFLTLNVEQLAAALESLTNPLPPRGIDELQKLAQERLTYLFQTLGNSLLAHQERGLAELFVAKLKAVLVYREAMLSNVEVNIALRSIFQTHAERLILGVLKQMKEICKEMPAVLEQVCELEATYKASVKRRLPV
jgi:hypothetical protein